LDAVMIAHNEGRYIERAVSSIWRFVRPERIVLIADACTDRTVEIAERLGVEVFEEENRHIGRTMRSGLEKADGRWVFFSPGDVEIVEDVQPLRELAVGDVFAVVGRVMHVCGCCWRETHPNRRQPWGAPFLCSILDRFFVLSVPGLSEKRSNEEKLICSYAFSRGRRLVFDDSRIYARHYFDVRSPIGALAKSRLAG